ncbi:hypothetical protein LIER_03051 [Lithospermum erythrorhizon]|uniref:Calmodulin-binding domain-containing protein n=1 Tax=Lithospermum erythrorhizon TaxID=34254 RepID=A0AAV3NT94_LITER
MATRIREGLPGKEKTLPHQGNPGLRKASPNASASPSRPIGPTTKSPSSDKNVPNYLRPTKSRPSADQPIQSAAVKKPASAAASTDKPSLAKGRSFNKGPAPASPSTRTLQSPNPKEKALRTSSSFSGSRSTGTTAQKGASNRILKTAATDVVKKHARPSSLKKSNNVTTKQSGESSRRTSMSSSIMSSPERIQEPEIVDVHHPQEDGHQSSVTDEEVSINGLSSHDNEATADVVKEEEQETETPVQAKPDAHKEEDIEITESATPVQSKPDAHKEEDIEITESATPVQTKPDAHKEQDIEITESATPVQTKPDVHKQEDVKITESATPDQTKPDVHKQEDIKVTDYTPSEVNNQVAAEGSMKTEDTPGKKTSSHSDSQQLQEQLQDNSTETTDAVNENLEVQAEDQGKEEVGDATEVTEKKEEVKQEDQVVNLRETADVENIARPEAEPEPELVPQSEAEATPATLTIAAKHSNTKKESSGVSNDTIEETASKLQEQRKNRVRALAGAFESVMQQPDK